MASFATPADLAVYLGRDEFCEAAEFLQAQMLLDLASDTIRRWARQTISLVANDTVVLAGSWAPELELPERPVVSVSAISVGGTALTADVGYSLSPAGLIYAGAFVTDFAYYPQGAAGRSTGSWGGPDARITVTYTHGFAVIPPSVKAVALGMAARTIASPGGERQESIAGYSATYLNTGGATVLTDAEMAALSWLRRRSL
jgi:hypothetical protein